METPVTFTVNRREHRVTTDPDRPLLDVLREDLRLTGTKFGCGEGHCGACTVWVDGRRERSCQWTIGEAAGKEIRTIESLASDGELTVVQRAFLAENAAQCGYCTAGMIMSATVLLADKPSPSDAEVVAWMKGHLCRCCNYASILRAIRRAADTMQGGPKA